MSNVPLPGGFWIGLHMPSLCRYFDRFCMSYNVVGHRKTALEVSPGGTWMLDSGAFTQVTKYGHHRTSPDEYARRVRRFYYSDDSLACAVIQDWMCEPFVLERTGLTVALHQHLTTVNWTLLTAALRDLHCPVTLMPVIQGYEPHEYVDHLKRYRDCSLPLSRGTWVGVGSVCKRNSTPASVMRVLDAVKSFRPDLRLHGFGLKVTAFSWPEVLCNLYSADSMAWSMAARRKGGDANGLEEAMEYYEKVMRVLGR
jgi:hypothetical protein